MPDRRKHRGAHPDDAKIFAADRLDALRLAVDEFSWLLSHGYAEKSALKLVGDRHDLVTRQRLAVWRSACSDESLRHRVETETSLAACAGSRIGADGYNLLITVESALAGGVLLVGRDGCVRDLAGLHGTYRKVAETAPAIEIVADYFTTGSVEAVDWYLDRPVSNSGRLKAIMAEVLESRGVSWNIELLDNPDSVLADYRGVVVTTDSWILDRCDRWVNVAAELIESRVPGAWTLDLRHGGTLPLGRKRK